MEKPNISQELEVTIERVLPFGVFVRLPDGTRGYIRRRELDLDADADPSQVAQKGVRIKVVVLSLGDNGKDVELSHRATLLDPWPEFAKQYQAGDTVRGSVRSIQPNGVFVRIQAGIDGFIPLEEFSAAAIDKPEEVFWLGDDVEAVITHIQPRRKFIHLSFNARILQYDQALEAARTLSQRPPIKLSKPVPTYEQRDTQKTDAIISEKVGQILIVEDNDQVRDSLTTWLSRRGFRVSAAKTAFQAIEMKSSPYKVLIVDLNLLEQDGLALVRQVRKDDHQTNIGIMSSPEMLAQRANDIQAAQIMEVFPKPLDLDEIDRFLLRIAKDDHLEFWQAERQTSTVVSQVASMQFSDAQTLARLQHALAEITSAIRAQTGLLFQLDPDSQTISIPIQVGRSQVNPSAIYALKGSPVNDVIKDLKPIFENRVTDRALARFDKLLNLLSFDSCIGVPIIVQGEVRHAAFFFHPNADAFPHSRLRDVQAGTLLLSAILTEEGIQARLRSLNPKLLSGELAASFGHDVFNKITALELQARNLVESDQADKGTSSQRLLELVLDLKNTSQAFQQMLLTKEQMEIVDANLVVQQALLLLGDLARKERTQIVSKLGSGLPPITGNRILVQQAFLNIMLNAIQQMAQKAEKLNWNGRRTLEVISLAKEDMVQIRFKDNGPGIHKESLRKIFVPGFSTRGGSGLGLYIARSFIQMLGGTLKVEATFVPLGTTFLVELPRVKEEIEHERTVFTPSNRG